MVKISWWPRELPDSKVCVCVCVCVYVCMHVCACVRQSCAAASHHVHFSAPETSWGLVPSVKSLFCCSITGACNCPVPGIMYFTASA